MANQQRDNDQSQENSAGYRGALVYRQEYGYKLLTLMIDLYTPDEQSRMISRLGEIDLIDEAEHIPACLPLVAIDLYHFAVTDGTEIELTITSQKATYTTRYTAMPAGIEELSASFWLDIIASGESRCQSA